MATLIECVEDALEVPPLVDLRCARRPRAGSRSRACSRTGGLPEGGMREVEVAAPVRRERTVVTGLASLVKGAPAPAAVHHGRLNRTTHTTKGPAPLRRVMRAPGSLAEKSHRLQAVAPRGEAAVRPRRRPNLTKGGKHAC